MARQNTLIDINLIILHGKCKFHFLFTSFFFHVVYSVRVSNEENFLLRSRRWGICILIIFSFSISGFIFFFTKTSFSTLDIRLRKTFLADKSSICLRSVEFQNDHKRKVKVLFTNEICLQLFVILYTFIMKKRTAKYRTLFYLL